MPLLGVIFKGDINLEMLTILAKVFKENVAFDVIHTQFNGVAKPFEGVFRVYACRTAMAHYFDHYCLLSHPVLRTGIKRLTENDAAAHPFCSVFGRDKKPSAFAGGRLLQSLEHAVFVFGASEFSGIGFNAGIGLSQALAEQGNHILQNFDVHALVGFEYPIQILFAH